jgi:sugar O-acyltransferase (sialic acid O-acetyltransferase NeuD family)
MRTMCPVIILGGGGHAKVLIDALQLSSIPIVGMVDPIVTSAFYEDVPLLGDDQAVLQYSPEEILLVNGIGSVLLPDKRKEIFHRFKALGYSFAKVIHPSAVISNSASISEGVQVMAGAIIQAGTVIGENSIINTRASVDHDCRIGGHVHIAPGAVLSGGIYVEEEVHIGTGSVLIQGITVQKRALIGAGAVVIRDVEQQQKVVGVPAKEILT